MAAPHTWDVDRVGVAIADAMRPLLSSATTVLFVDPYFDIHEAKYQETLKACLDVIHASGGARLRCEIHFCDYDKRQPLDSIERDAQKWIPRVLPAGMSFTIFIWKERKPGADFHARYLLTDVGGINLESGFSAEGAHQKVQLGLLSLDLAQNRLNALARNSTDYDLVWPVLEVRSDGTINRKA